MTGSDDTADAPIAGRQQGGASERALWKVGWNELLTPTRKTMTLVEFEVGDPEPYEGEVAIRAKSPEAKQRGDSQYWFVVAIVRPQKPVGQGPTECAAWIKRNLIRIAPHIELEYRGEPLRFDLGRLRELYGD